MAIVRAISIRQPYVELILKGIKKNEFRDIRTKIRERVWLYASLSPADDAQAWGRVHRERGSLPVGRIVGSVEIVGCRKQSGGDFAYQLAHPRRITKRLRHKNQPQPIFWRPKF